MISLQTVLQTSVAKSVGPKAGAVSLAAKQSAPEILLIGGLVSGLVSGVMLARAYKKHEQVISPVVEDLEDAVTIIATNEQSLNEERTAAEHDLARETISGYKTMLPKIYAEIVGRALRLYGPSVLMGGVSVYMILTSHGIMKNRNAAIMGAFALLEKGYSAYRKRVVDELGPEADERYFYGAEQRVTTVETIGEDGKKVKTKRTTNAMPEVADPKQLYTRVFDSKNKYASDDRDWNYMFLRAMQQQAQDKLTLNGHVMLNTVLGWLGFDDTPEGALTGWSKKSVGDGYVDFGLDREVNMNSGENRFYLDFNVNGSVWQMI